MKKLLFAFVLFLSLTSIASSQAAQTDTWREKTLYGKYLPKGPGWEIVGEINEITDVEKNQVVGYDFSRETRNYFIMVNDGQPYLEAWDFPNTCPGGCHDSKMARVTFIPFKGINFLGELRWEINKTLGLFRFFVNDQLFLSVNMESMNPEDGIILEDSSVAPKELRDPSIICNSSVTCIRSLAFGQLAHENISKNYQSQVHFSDGVEALVPNNKLYNPARSERSGFLFSDEEALRKSILSN